MQDSIQPFTVSSGLTSDILEGKSDQLSWYAQHCCNLPDRVVAAALVLGSTPGGVASMLTLQYTDSHEWQPKDTTCTH